MQLRKKINQINRFKRKRLHYTKNVKLNTEKKDWKESNSFGEGKLVSLAKHWTRSDWSASSPFLIRNSEGERAYCVKYIA